MKNYIWKTEINAIQGTSHPTTTPNEIPWSFSCGFTILPEDNGEYNHGRCLPTQIDIIKNLVDAWIQSKEVEITATTSGAIVPDFIILSVRVL